jgi:aspartyl aminopeptidase
MLRNAVVVSIAAVASVGLSRAASADDTVGHRTTAWEQKGFAKREKAVRALGKDYKQFLGANKTEREVIAAALKLAAKQGFKRDLFGDATGKLKPGSKAYAQVHGKLAALVIVGKQPLSEGVHIVAAHVDSVRLDLKQNPLYADGNLAMLETHYYGGVKKYQWLSEPLELRGVVVKKGGKVVHVAIGDDEDEPVLVVPDIAKHVSFSVDRDEGEQVPGEKLDAVLSSTPAARAGAGEDPFAAEAARLLESEYGIALDDLESAELELVPAANPRDVGIDRALIGGYGQDDRACAYAALRALFDVRAPEHTAIVMLLDKEEIGSGGNTGAKSNFVRRVVAELLVATGVDAGELDVNRALAASMVFSADVSGAINPQYAELYDPKNNAFIGAGLIWDQSAVHAEVMSYVRSLFESAGVLDQAADWTKVGKSGGGTVLPYFTQHGMNGLDVSIPLLSMHSTYELISVADLYEGYRGYKAFLSD